MNENNQAPEKKEKFKPTPAFLEGLWVFEIALGLITSAVALIAAMI